MSERPSGEGARRVLCAHADQNGEGAHWKNEGEPCCVELTDKRSPCADYALSFDTLIAPHNDDGEVRHEEAMQLLAGLDTGTVDMVFADPPYGIGYHSNHHKGRNPHAPVANDWNFQIGPFLAEVGRVLVEGGAAYVCCRWDIMPLWASNIAPPLKLKSAIAWVKDNHSAGDLTGTFGNKYEIVLFLVKGRHLLRGKRWPNVWEFARIPPKSMLHPTQKPVGLVERAIGASTDTSGLVVDPFSGSGTTALAARNLSRRFLVGDIDPAMVDMTKRRLGFPVDEGPVCPVEEVRPATSFAWQIEHQFGAPADDLALIATSICATPIEASAAHIDGYPASGGGAS